MSNAYDPEYSSLDNELPDEDPLAELARIVAGEPEEELSDEPVQEDTAELLVEAGIYEKEAAPQSTEEDLPPMEEVSIAETNLDMENDFAELLEDNLIFDEPEGAEALQPEALEATESLEYVVPEVEALDLPEPEVINSEQLEDAFEVPQSQQAEELELAVAETIAPETDLPPAFEPEMPTAGVSDELAKRFSDVVLDDTAAPQLPDTLPRPTNSFEDELISFLSNEPEAPEAPEAPEIPEIPEAPEEPAPEAALEAIPDYSPDPAALPVSIIEPEVEEPSVERSIEDEFASEFEEMFNNPSAEREIIEDAVEYAPAVAEPFPDDTQIQAEAEVYEQAEDGVELDFESLFEEELQNEQVEVAAIQEAIFEPEHAQVNPPVAQFDGVADAFTEPDHIDQVPPIESGAEVDGSSSNEKSGGGARPYAIAALVIALFAGVIVTGYGFLGSDATTSGDQPPLIQADRDPIKLKPDDPGGRVIANQDKASYGKVEGQNLDAGGQNSLVSNTEEPVKVQKNRLVETNLEPKGSDRLTASDAANNNADEGITGIAPRVVQTLTVKPDGTIVKSETPNLLSQAENSIANAANAANEALNSASSDLQTVASEISKPKPVETTVITQQASIDGAKETGSLAIPEVSPLPKPVQVAAAPKITAPAPKPVVTASAPATPAPQPAASSEWVVQVSSQRSREAAQTSYQNMQNRFSALQGRPINIQQANVNGSTFYRVRVQTASRSDANQLCNGLKNSGGSCFVTR